MLDTTSTQFDHETLPDTLEEQRIAEKGRRGLREVASGEDCTITGWLMYGEALHEGRARFKTDDRAFGHWIDLFQLGTDDRRDQAAALWATDPAHPGRFEETRKANPRVRTVRGLWAKWNADQKPKVEPELDREEPTEADLRRMGALRDTINHPTTLTHVRANAQTKLNDYLERFGDVSNAQSAETRSFRGSDEVGDEIVSLVVSLCQTEYRVRSFLRDAIVHRYRFNKRTSLEDVLATLQQIKRQPAE